MNQDQRVAYLEARVGELHQTIGDLRGEQFLLTCALDRSEASRRDWATEALRLQDLVDKANVAMRHFRDRVRKVNDARREERPALLQRLVDDSAPSLPQCCVHPDRGGNDD